MKLEHTTEITLELSFSLVAFPSACSLRSSLLSLSMHPLIAAPSMHPLIANSLFYAPVNCGSLHARIDRGSPIHARVNCGSTLHAPVSCGSPLTR